MPTTTSPDSLPQPVGSDVVAPLQNHFAGAMTATQAALLKRDILHYANTAAFPAASTVPWRFVLDESTLWMFFSNGTKYYAAFPLTNHPIDGVTTNEAAVAERRQKLSNEYVQTGDPGHEEGRKWLETP